MTRIVIIPAARPLTCPLCGKPVSWRRVAVRFTCRQCRQGLQLRRSYFLVLYLCACLIGPVLVSLMSVSGDARVLLSVFSIIPTYYAMLFVTVRLFAPELEPSGEYRSLLYDDGSDDAETNELERDGNADDSRVTVPSSTRTAPLGTPAFTLPAEHRSLEGFVIKGVTLLVLVMGVYAAVLPLVYRLFPSFRATRDGPPGFRVTVHIGEDDIRIDNGSTKPWKCTAELGALPRHAASFAIEWGSSTRVPYSRFMPAMPADAMRSAARNQIDLSCEEPSGLTHSATLN